MREPGFIKRPPRVDIRHQAMLTDSDGNCFKVIVTDISSDGCRLETDGELRIGEQVEIEVERLGKMPAQIRWALGREAGAKFLEPMKLDD